MSRAEYGDVIGVKHGMYTHFGVYVDDEHVIHYDGKEDDMFLRRMYIDETGIDRFLGGADQYYVYKFSDKGYRNSKPVRCKNLNRSSRDVVAGMYLLLKLKHKLKYKVYSPEETVKRARSRIGERKFNLALNNCESFAIWCKTGITESSQVDLVIQALFIESIISII